MTRAEKKAATRERLLEAAERIAVHEGFGRVTLDRVAERAGVTKGAIYSNFASKEDLLLELFDRLTPHLNLTSEVLDAPDLSGLLKRGAAELSRISRTRSKEALFTIEFYALALRDHRLRRALVRNRKAEEAVEDADDFREWLATHGAVMPRPEREFFEVVNALALGLLVHRLLYGAETMPDDLIEWAFARLHPSD